MPKINFVKKLSLFFVFFLMVTKPAHAIPPPDFILSAASSALQILGFVGALLVASFFWFKDLVMHIFRKRKWMMAVITFLILALPAGGYFYVSWSQQKAAWEEQLRKELAGLRFELEIQARQDAVFDDSWEKFLSINQVGTENAAHDLLDYNYAISAERYMEMTKDGIKIIDVREDRPFERGRIPCSIHYRMTDFLRGGMERSGDRQR